MEVVSTRLAIRITTPPYVKLGITNGAAIRIITVGSTAQQAHGTATNAAARLCVIVHDLYGSTAEVDDSTDRSRRYSVYYDGIQPNVIRSLKR
jgi:hypothetical protein